MIDSALACHGRQCNLGSVNHLKQHSFASALQPHRLVARRSTVTVRASVQARPASIEFKTFDGTSSGTQELALQVAGQKSAKGLVHRYLVTVRQNARAVRPSYFSINTRDCVLPVSSPKTQAQDKICTYRVQLAL